MKATITILLLTFSSILNAVEIEGTISWGTGESTMNRSSIPYDGFKKKENGRVYYLWFHPNAAMLFFLENPWDFPSFQFDGQDERFRFWVVATKEKLALPDGALEASNDARAKIEGIEELVGRGDIAWNGDFNYKIELDLKGMEGIHTFKGSLYGSPQN